MIIIIIELWMIINYNGRMDDHNYNGSMDDHNYNGRRDDRNYNGRMIIIINVV